VGQDGLCILVVFIPMLPKFKDFVLSIILELLEKI